MAKEFRVERKGGRIKVIGKKASFTYPPKEVAIHKLFNKKWKPTPFECYKCRRKTMFRVKSRRVGPEVAMVRFTCVGCGYSYEEPVD